MRKKIVIGRLVKTFVFDQQPIDNAWIFDVYVHDRGDAPLEFQYCVKLQPYKNWINLAFVPVADTSNLPAWVLKDETIYNVSFEIKAHFKIKS